MQPSRAIGWSTGGGGPGEGAIEPDALTNWRWRFARGFSSMAEAGLGAIALDPTGEWLAVGSETGVAISKLQAGGAVRSVRVRGVRDLLYGPDGELLIATAHGFWRLPPGPTGALEQRSPGPGENARRIHRIAAIATDVGLSSEVRVVLVATDGGAFVSTSGFRSRGESSGAGSPAQIEDGYARVGSAWLRLDAEFPSGPVTSVAISRGGEGVLWLWALVESALWRVALEPDGQIRDVREVRIPHRPREVLPVDLVTGLPGADLVIVYPGSLSVLSRDSLGSAGRSSIAGSLAGLFDEYRPGLPPGASLRRVGAWRGRFWFATDRGLLTARSLAGPLRRAASPAGRIAFASLVGTSDRLYGAGDRGLLFATVGFGPRIEMTGVFASSERDSHWLPSVRRVQQAALAHLGLGREVFVEAHRGLSRRGWLPSLSLRFGVDRDTSSGWDEDQAFLSGATRFLRDEDRGRSLDLAGSITMTWSLRDLAYDPEWLDLSREGRLVIALRDDVLDEINQLYFELRALQQLRPTNPLRDPGQIQRDRTVSPAMLSSPAGSAESSEHSPTANADALRVALRIAELTAGLDAWTGGWFSERLADRDSGGTRGNRESAAEARQ